MFQLSNKFYIPRLAAAGNVDSKIETEAYTVDLSEDASVGSAVQNLNIFVEDLDKVCYSFYAK